MCYLLGFRDLLDCPRHLFDLVKEMPNHGISDGDREGFWDDGLHFTAKGYEKMGRLVARRMLEVLGVVESGK